MSFLFTPLSDEQIRKLQNPGLIAEGIYSFIVREAEQTHSKTGSQMLKLRLGVFDANKAEHSILDWLVITDQMMFKLKSFCEAVGLLDKYEAGIIGAVDCLNRQGRVKIGVQKGNPKDDGSGFFPDKNTVKAYLKPDGKETFVDSDITF